MNEDTSRLYAVTVVIEDTGDVVKNRLAFRRECRLLEEERFPFPDPEHEAEQAQRHTRYLRASESG